jgi:hypothetical protein
MPLPNSALPHAPARHGAKASFAPFLVAVALIVLAGVFLVGLERFGD